MASTDGKSLFDALGEVSQLLISATETDDTMERITQAAKLLLDHPVDASVMMVAGDDIISAGCTSEEVVRGDEIQQEVGEGPCLDAIAEHKMFHIKDVEHEDRWPEFAKRLRQETDLRSMASYVLWANDGSLGSLNLYSKRTEAFSDQDLHLSALFAAQAGLALAKAKNKEEHEEEIANLRKALESRDVIGRAKGILMAREKITDEEAFEMLKHASQNLNVKLRDVADAISKDMERRSKEERGSSD